MELGNELRPNFPENLRSIREKKCFGRFGRGLVGFAGFQGRLTGFLSQINKFGDQSEVINRFWDGLTGFRYLLVF